MLQTKALYNLLRINAREDASLKAEPWALENLRPLPLEKLWVQLAKLGISLDRESFLHFAEECDSPEDLTDLLEDDTENRDRVYLLLFELWRRLLPERPSLSIFCDELDDRIDRYDSGSLKSDEPIQDGLASLLDILEEHVDAGMNPQVALASVSDYCANDLIRFLYDYISEQLDEGNSLYASELLEDFAPYLPDPLRLDFLAARLVSFTDIKQANQVIKSLLAKDLDPDLLFDILRLLVTAGEHDLFQGAMRKLIPHLTAEEDFHEAIDLAADYYRRLDLDTQEQALLRLKKSPNLAEFQKLVLA